MFGLVYLEKGKPKAHVGEFKTMLQAEEFAKTKRYEQFKVIPTQTGKIDFSRGIFDIGLES